MAERDHDHTTPRRRLVVMFDRFGPYHVARLDAVTRDFAVTGMECFGESEEYAWQKVGTPSSFQRLTLFPGRCVREVGRPELSAATNSALASIRPDAVAIPGWSHPGARAALQWCLNAGTPAVLMSESTAHDARRSVGKEWIKSRIVRLFSAALVGGRTHAAYLSRLHFPSARVFTGYDAVDNDYFAGAAAVARAQAESLRARLGLPVRYFLASARFIPKKNLPVLLRAYAEYVHECGPEPWELVLLGDGPLRDELAAQAVALGLNGRIHFPGFQQYEQLPAYYALASAFVHASTEEPWGLVVNEAMACGLPVLVSNRCGCASELVGEGRNGFTFDPADARQLAALLGDMARRPDRASMARVSEEIINRWGPVSFAEGMKAAVDAATALAPRSGAWTGRALLRAMMLK